MRAIIRVVLDLCEANSSSRKCALFLVDLEKQELISTIVDHGDLHGTNFVNVEPIR